MNMNKMSIQSDYQATKEQKMTICLWPKQQFHCQLHTVFLSINYVFHVGNAVFKSLKFWALAYSRSSYTPIECVTYFMYMTMDLLTQWWKSVYVLCFHLSFHRFLLKVFSFAVNIILSTHDISSYPRVHVILNVWSWEDLLLHCS